MRRHETPILKMDELPRSTYYYWLGKLHRLYTLCVWAGWYKARPEIPTLDAIWGTSSFEAYVYWNRRTNEMMVSTSNPGAGWVSYGTRSESKETTDKILSGINLVGLSVHEVLVDNLGKKDLKRLLQILPVTGKFQGDYWAEEEEKQWAEVENLHSLRDINRPIVTDEELRLIRLASHVLADESIRAAVAALDGQAAIIPPKYRPQKSLFSS